MFNLKNSLKLKKAIKASISEFAVNVKAGSMRKSPVDTGNLRASHQTEVAVEGNDYTGVVFNTAEYALFVHESLSSRHIVGEAKFLENSLIENTPFYLSILKDRIHSELL